MAADPQNVRMRARQACDARKLLAEIEDYVPLYPKQVGSSEAARLKFLRDQVTSLKGPIPVIPDRKGFIRKGLFLGHGAIVRDGKIEAGGPELLHSDGSNDLRGTALGTQTRILQLAEVSDYLAFGIGIALAALLQSYVRLYGSDLNSRQLLSEGAIFLFTGKSASGKSTLQRACLSLGGSPNRMTGFDFSRRGLAELAADNNDHMSAR
jgi:Domain of unknown function (DUF927)